MKTQIIAISLLALVAACSEPADAPLTKSGIEISDARIRLPLNGVTTTAAYVSLTNNNAAPIEIVSGESNIAKTVELHEHTVGDSGMMEMREVESFAIAPNETLVLAPMGKHIMLFEVTAPVKEGDVGRITLNTKSGEKIEIDANFVANPSITSEHNGHMENKSKSGHENHPDN